MKKQLLSILAFTLLVSFSAGAQGINFRKGTWAEIKAQAKAENKHIFVDAYTTWCGPCKWLSKKIFPQKKAGDFFNEKYVSFKLDMEKGEGLDFAKKNKVKAYPTLVYFNPQGEMVHKTVGAYPADKLIETASDALDTDKQAYTLMKKFEKGERGNKFLKNYIVALDAAYEDFGKPTAIYLKQLGKKNWAKKDNWKFIRKFVRSSSSNAFEYVLEKQKKFAKIDSKENVDKYIAQVLTFDTHRIARSKDKNKLASFKKKLQKVFGKDAEKHIAKADYMFYARDKEKSLQYACKYFDNYCENANEFNSIAWRYYRSKNDMPSLEKALAWAKQSVKLSRKSYNTDTQAHLLYKLKRYKEATKVAKESIALAKEEKGDASETQKLLEKIKAKM